MWAKSQARTWPCCSWGRLGDKEQCYVLARGQKQQSLSALCGSALALSQLKGHKQTLSGQWWSRC
jgi:hypothetical protein